MPTRRQFISTASLASAAALTGPLSARTSLPTVSHDTVLGHGDFRYRPDPSWGNLDTARQGIMHCHEMVEDSRGRLVCSTVSENFDALVYDKDGKMLASFNHNLVEPHGLTKVGEGSDQTFWMTDPESGRVVNLDLDGRLIQELDIPQGEIPEGQQYKPTETAVAANGDVYVADGYGTNLIFQYDAKGRLKKVFGGPDHFDCCHGIVVDDRRGSEELLITSRAAQNFQRWSMDGQHIQTRELPGLQICRPVISGELTLFAVIVTKSWWHYDGMVAVLDKDFNVVSLPGGTAPEGQEDFNSVRQVGGAFMNPHDVCADSDGNLYVPQWYSGRTYPVRLRRV